MNPPRYQRIESVRYPYYAALVGGPRGNTILKVTTSRLVGAWWRIFYGPYQS